MNCLRVKTADKDWLPAEAQPNEDQKRKLFGKVLEVMVATTFSNHIYVYRNDLFRQARGGAIGLRLTGVVARIVMDRWARLMIERLNQAEVSLFMLKKYVDDVNLCLALIEDGWFWQQEGRKPPVFIWTQERELEDKSVDASPQEKTMGKIQDLANM